MIHHAATRLLLFILFLVAVNLFSVRTIMHNDWRIRKHKYLGSVNRNVAWVEAHQHIAPPTALRFARLRGGKIKCADLSIASRLSHLNQSLSLLSSRSRTVQRQQQQQLEHVPTPQPKRGLCISILASRSLEDVTHTVDLLVKSLLQGVQGTQKAQTQTTSATNHLNRLQLALPLTVYDTLSNQRRPAHVSAATDSVVTDYSSLRGVPEALTVIGVDSLAQGQKKCHLTSLFLSVLRDVTTRRRMQCTLHLVLEDDVGTVNNVLREMRQMLHDLESVAPSTTTVEEGDSDWLWIKLTYPFDTLWGWFPEEARWVILSAFMLGTTMFGFFLALVTCIFGLQFSSTTNTLKHKKVEGVQPGLDGVHVEGVVRRVQRAVNTVQNATQVIPGSAAAAAAVTTSSLSLQHHHHNLQCCNQHQQLYFQLPSCTRCTYGINGTTHRDQQQHPCVVSKWVLCAVLLVFNILAVVDVYWVGPAMVTTAWFAPLLPVQYENQLTRTFHSDVFAGTVAHLYNLNSTMYSGFIQHVEAHELACKTKEDKVFDLAINGQDDVCGGKGGVHHCYMHRPALFQHVGVSLAKDLRVDLHPGVGLGAQSSSSVNCEK
jgi:hypothetical protein